MIYRAECKDVLMNVAPVSRMYLHLYKFAVKNQVRVLFNNTRVSVCVC
jgi:hypothetical protein